MFVSSSHSSSFSIDLSKFSAAFPKRYFQITLETYYGRKVISSLNRWHQCLKREKQYLKNSNNPYLALCHPIATANELYNSLANAKSCGFQPTIIVRSYMALRYTKIATFSQDRPYFQRDFDNTAQPPKTKRRKHSTTPIE